MKAFLPLLLFALVGAAGPGTGGPGSGGLMGPGSSGPGATSQRKALEGFICSFAPDQAPGCSDGRKITTVSTTPRPCEQQKGVLTDVPPNTACVTWDGKLQAMGPNTTLIVNGNDLLGPDWAPQFGGTVTALSPGYRITSTGTSYLRNTIAGLAGEPRTTACILRAGTATRTQIFSAAIAAGGSACEPALTSSWTTASCTSTTTAAGSVGVYIYPNGNGLGTTGYVDALACWHAKATVPGRACFGTNAAGTTCDGDRHTISTAGFPTTSGKISMVVERTEQNTASAQILDTRGAGGDTTILVTGSNILQIASGGVTTNHGSVGAAPGKFTLELFMRPDGVDVYVDGAARTTRVGAMGSWGTSSTLGVNYVGNGYINGSISLLKVETPTGGSCTGTRCSDGRLIATARSTPVPCETAPGVFTDVGVNQACVTWDGRLEAWGANTTVIQNGAPSALGTGWTLENGATLTPMGTYSILTRGASAGGISAGSFAPVAGKTYTLAAHLRAGTLSRATLAMFNGVVGAAPNCIIPLGAAWGVVSCTATAEAIGTGASNGRRKLYFQTPDPEGSTYEVGGVWATETATPGRPCWGTNAAGTTCAADVHTVSTAGWPTTSGRVEITYTPGGPSSNVAMYLVDSRVPSGSGIYFYRISATGALVAGLRSGVTASAQSGSPLTWEDGRPYRLVFKWSSSRASVTRDGVEVIAWVPTVVPDTHASFAQLGGQSTTESLNGSISNLSWSTK